MSQQSVGAPSRRDLLNRARRLGIEVRNLRRTGDILVRVPGRPSLRINARRKDVTRAFRKLIINEERRTA